jgi:hypothetical protein
MVHKRRDMWGFAVGCDARGERRRITIYRTQDGFDFVSETLYCHPIVAPGKPSAEQLRGEVAKAFGLADVKFEFPHLGIFASAPPIVPEQKSSGLSTRRYTAR